MTGRRVIPAALAAAFLLAASSARAQEAPPEEPAPAATPAPVEPASPAPAPVESTPEAAVASPAVAGQGQPLSSIEERLACAHTVCRCEPGTNPETGETDPCATIACRCVPSAPRARPAPLHAAPSQREGPIPQAEILWQPVGGTGFNIPARHVGLRLELGFPFMAVEFFHGAHRRVTWGVGYRNLLYSVGHAGYGLLKVLVAENQRRSLAFSMTATFGWNWLRDDYAEYLVTSGDSGYGELLGSLSYRRNRNALDFLLGVRLSWIREQDCDSEYEYDCYDYVFEDGRAGLLAAIVFDFGWTIRITHTLSYYIDAGFEVYPNVYSGLPANYRVRSGLLFEF